MTMFAAVLLVSVVLAICVSTAVGFALPMFDGRSPAMRQQVAMERAAEVNEPMPIDSTDPRLPL